MNKYRIKFIELEGGEWNLDRAEPTLTVRSYGADRLHAVENAIASRLVRDKLRRLLGLTGKQFVQLFYSASFEGLIQEDEHGVERVYAFDEFARAADFLVYLRDFFGMELVIEEC